MRVLVDSSVLLDVLTQDPRWAPWSEEKLAWHAERDLLAINPIIYAEVSTRFASIEELDEALSPADFRRLPLPYEAGFLAAKCFLEYRSRVDQGPTRLSIPSLGITAAPAGRDGLWLVPPGLRIQKRPVPLAKGRFGVSQRFASSVKICFRRDPP